MNQENRISFLEVIKAIIVEPAWYWLITIIPTTLTILQGTRAEVPEQYRDRFMISHIYNLLPYWAWILISVGSFFLTVTIGAYRFVKRKIEPQLAISVSSRAESGGQSIISGRDTHIYPPTESKQPNITIGISDENELL